MDYRYNTTDEGSPQAAKIDYKQPVISPYEYYNIQVTIGQTIYGVPRYYLEQCPGINPRLNPILNNPISLNDVDEDVGHTLINFLCTGTYETLRSPSQPDESDLVREYRRSVLAYHSARIYNLPRLADLARGYVEGFTGSMTLSTILATTRRVFSKLPEDEIWLPAYIKEVFEASFADDETIFKSDWFFAGFGEDSEFDEALMRMVVDIYSARVSNLTTALANQESASPVPVEPKTVVEARVEAEPEPEPEAEPEAEPEPEPEPVPEVVVRALSERSISPIPPSPVVESYAESIGKPPVEPTPEEGGVSWSSDPLPAPEEEPDLWSSEQVQDVTEPEPVHLQEPQVNPSVEAAPSYLEEPAPEAAEDPDYKPKRSQADFANLSSTHSPPSPVTDRSFAATPTHDPLVISPNPPATEESAPRKKKSQKKGKSNKRKKKSSANPLDGGVPTTPSPAFPHMATPVIGVGAA